MQKLATPTKTHYKSKFYLRSIQQDQVRKEMEEAKAELKALLQDKKANYAKYVHDIHKPAISFSK